MSPNPPKAIYRYQRFSVKTVESLCHDTLYFANPAAFNDPLDCQPTIDADSDIDTLRHLLFELVKRRVEAESLAVLNKVHLTSKKAAAHAQRLGEQAARTQLTNIADHATNPEYDVSEEEAERWLLTSDIQHELLRKYDRGVCCFSAAVDNPLLWSHYGDQHRGLCIGYGLARTPKPRLRKVVYGGSRIVATSLLVKALLENDPEAQELLDHHVLLRKAASWRYEREWRLLGDRGVQDSVLELKDVTFGMRFPAALMHAVIAALESREEITFYMMYEVRGSFKLKRKPVDTGEMRAFFPRTARSGVEIFGPLITDDDTYWMHPEGPRLPNAEFEDVLRFWFPEHLSDDHAAMVTQFEWWFRGGADDAITGRFQLLLERAARGERDHWSRTPRSRLALIIVLDQFSRSVYRGTARAYAQDPNALALALEGIEIGHYAAFDTPWEKTFFFMPLGHSEELAHLETAVGLAEELVAQGPPELRRVLEHSAAQARGHRDVIARFGRHPHRNAVLGRQSTPEELDYLGGGQLVHMRMPPH